MSIFITGGTGFIGGYVIAQLLRDHPDIQLAVMTRAKDNAEATDKLWRSLQLHMDAERFYAILPQLTIVQGDLHAPNLGIDDATTQALCTSVDSIIHIAASLNRKSAKACLNTNLRGTLSVLRFAQTIDAAREGGLRRFSHVSTVAVCGHRDKEVVQEDDGIDWARSDYDPYGRTKKFCEHMARELLPNVPKTFFRPSIVMGDSRFAATTQFDMVRAFCLISDLPVIPFRDGDRLDVVPADWVGYAIATLHMAESTKHDIYHLSSGTAAPTLGQVAHAMTQATGKRARFAPRLFTPFQAVVNQVGGWRAKNPVAQIGALLKVFLPYITWDTVFDNRRAVAELDRAPTPFVDYCGDLYTFATTNKYRYPYKPLPPRPAGDAAEAAA